MDQNSKIAKKVPKMFQDSRCLTETPRFLDEIPWFPIDRNSKISEIPKPKVPVHSEKRSIFPLVRDEQTNPHRPRLVVSHSTCPPLSSPPHANSFVGPAVIKHTRIQIKITSWTDFVQSGQSVTGSCIFLENSRKITPSSHLNLNFQHRFLAPLTLPPPL